MPLNLNPFTYGGLADSAMSSAIAGARALRSAADQQARLEEQKRQKRISDAFNLGTALEKAGYIQLGVPGDNRPSILKGGPGAPEDVSRVREDPFGRRWAAPAPKPDATPQQTYTDLATALSRGGQPVSAENGTVWQDTQTPRLRETQPDLNQPSSLANTGLFGVHVPPPDPARVVTAPGSKQGVYMPPEADTLAEKLRVQAAGKAPPTQHIDTSTFSEPLIINPQTGEATRIKLPQGVTQKPKTEKEAPFHYTVDKAGTVHVFQGAKEVATVPGAGAPRKDPNAAPAERKATAGQLNTIEGKKKAAYVRANLKYKSDIKDVQGIPEMVNQAAETRREAQQVAQDAYESALTQFGYPVEHYEVPLNADSAAPPAPASGQPATPAAPPPKAAAPRNPYR